jgi:hypothetical protein
MGVAPATVATTDHIHTLVLLVAGGCIHLVGAGILWWFSLQYGHAAQLPVIGIGTGIYSNL